MSLSSSLRSNTSLACRIASVLVLGAVLTACSASSASGGDGGKQDASLDADDDATTDSGAGPDDVPIYPEAPSLLSPDGCYRQGASCMTGTTCCSAYCFEGGCEISPKMM